MHAFCVRLGSAMLKTSCKVISELVLVTCAVFTPPPPLHSVDMESQIVKFKRSILEVIGLSRIS